MKQEKKILSGVAVIILSLIFQNLHGQVVIKEKVEIQPQKKESQLLIKNKLTEHGGRYYPVLHRLEEGKYLILKSGELKFYFEEASSYGIEAIEDHVLNYSIKGPTTNIEASAKVADYMNGPITIKEGAAFSCKENQTYFTSNITIPVGPTDDTWIEINNDSTINGASDVLDVKGMGFLPPIHPDLSGSTAFLQFGIGEIETNAALNKADFLIVAETTHTNVESDFFIYTVDGSWDQESLTYINRPPTITSDFITVTPYDTVLSEDHTYVKDLTPLVSAWLNGSQFDGGIRIASSTRHLFSSKETYFGTIPTLSLNFSLPEKEVDHILTLGQVQAGDTLDINYFNFTDSWYHNFTLNADSVEAENVLSLFETTPCQTQNLLKLLPVIQQEDSIPGFEFTPNHELTLPTDTSPFNEVYIEPQIKFDNGNIGSPGGVLSSYRMQIYDVESVRPPGAPESTPVALLRGEPDGIAYLSPYGPGDDIRYLTTPEAVGATFKLRIMGEFWKGFMPTKQNLARQEKSYSTNPLKKASKINSNIVNDPSCGLAPEVLQDDVFVSCFEFTIGAFGIEIMLGESKYFYAVEDTDDPSKLLIKELPVNNNSTETLTLPNDGVADAFSSDDIIEVLSGGKSGIYWERKRSIINDEGFITVQELPNGIVRLIGRYWEADKEYSVNLNASSGSRSGALEIKVVRPDKLGDDYGKARDVFDNEYDVDSLLIVYGGQFGIPPQWLKAQADIESVKTPAFQLSTGSENGFHPGFRYEALNWEFTVRNKVDVNGNKYSDSPFWVTETSMGENSPPDHTHTRYQNYYTTPTTVWDIVKEYSDLVEDKSLRLYARKDGTRLNFISYGYKNLQKVYNDEIYPFFEEDFEGDSLYIMSRDSMATYLKNTWKGPEDNEPENFEGGLENLYAQTRLASSYGLLQTMYVTATERGYKINSENKPEDLNENDVSFPIFMKHHTKNLRTIVGTEYLEDSNWDEGFENVLKELMQKWNPYKIDYDDLVTTSQKKFNPSNE